MNTQLWHRTATIERNNFIHKSLSCWSYNVAIGCAHACRFCYVPEVSTNRMASKLDKFGVKDPDAEWGDYVFPRQWDEKAFVRSLADANAEMLAYNLTGQGLNADGNKAVMLCTTTDPYQTLRHENPDMQRDLNTQMQLLVERALEIIYTESELNVRILTRSPLAKRDFGLMKQFGNRLLFGMSLPTLNNKLARIYEPNAPAPSQRLATLQAAKAAGLNVYVAVAPTYPECDAADMERTVRAVKELDPVTVFMEPINIRAKNIARIEQHAAAIGETMQTGVFKTPERWRYYAMHQMHAFENSARTVGLTDEQVHLWPDQSLGSKAAIKLFTNPADESGIALEMLDLLGMPYDKWLNKHWNKISAWPK